MRRPAEPGGVVSRGRSAVTRAGSNAARDGNDERALIHALRARDEAAFEALFDRHYSAMIRLAQGFVRSRDEAEEVVQDTWVAVLRGVDRFEGRASLKTWIFRILVNRARTRARREARSLPFSAVRERPDTSGSLDSGVGAEPLGTSAARSDWASRWDTPEESVLGDELNRVIVAAIDELPARQREVITLRDLEGWSAAEVEEILEISEGNQRVLLHRARVKVRDAIAPYLEATGDDARFAPAAR